MDYPNLSRAISPCLFSNNTSTNFDLFILSSNQSLLFQVFLENYKLIFDQLIQQEIEYIYKNSIYGNDGDDNDHTEQQPPVVAGQSDNIGRESSNSKNFNFRSSLTNIATKLKPKGPAPPPPTQSTPIVSIAATSSVPDSTERSSATFYDTTTTNGETIEDNPIKANFSFAWNKQINIENVAKQKDTNIPELVYSIVQTLTINKLNQTEEIYSIDMNYDEMKLFVEMLKRRNDDEIKRFNNGNHLGYFLKEYLKLFEPPLLKSSLPDFDIYSTMTKSYKKCKFY